MNIIIQIEEPNDMQIKLISQIEKQEQKKQEEKRKVLKEYIP